DHPLRAAPGPPDLDRAAHRPRAGASRDRRGLRPPLRRGLRTRSGGGRRAGRGRKRGLGVRVDLGLNAVIVAVTEEVPRILTVRRSRQSGAAEDALPFGPLEPEKDRTLDLALRRWVREQTGLELGYVEQLYTFGDRLRDPRETRGGPRMVSVAYLALVREVSVRRDARWRDWYEFFPWEDWRSGRPAAIDRFVAPALDAWVAGAPDPLVRKERRQRADIVFGLGGVGW